MAELHDLLHTLPQELFDKIYDMTFAVNPAATIAVDESYKPPVQLQISRATREDFAKRYYGSQAGFRSKDMRDRKVFQWLSNLPANHQRRISRIDLATFRHYTMQSRDVKMYLQIVNSVGIRNRDVHLKSRSVLQIGFVDTATGEEMYMSAKGPVARQ
ncbi:uncharacterized protein MYCFIDRAFT_77881 [Pseudocercospora fijiensis CIRAD86]|uniref:Uncharacterized protein n=1 Tax=Pseudocercospora fijiensis (strain CIRAD86) TaxID=383855 RepID=M2ZM04_PSEFD|nr:uncharacterized protein MYCFIDRAFT_77881 [Pseudocercospora fijiensis CIRAD86]EME80099.1 hypothetical protein MYCFIDRAFT_77881 [Pseudocercospora fijiensis CIRAD86]